MVALIGADRDYPPTDDAAFLALARGLRSPLLYETMKAAEPVSAIFGYRNTDNRRRHFERLRRWPEALSSSATPAARSTRSTVRA